MKLHHSREEVRFAKNRAADHFRDDASVTSVGIGITEDQSDYAVTITVSSHQVLSRIPATIGSVPVRTAVAGEAAPFSS